MNIENMKNKLEKLGCIFKEPYSSGMVIDMLAENIEQDDCIINQMENYPYCIYEFKEESGAKRWFKRWSEYYKDISESKFDIESDLKYERCEQNVSNNGYYFVLIKLENVIFWAHELWKNKQRLERILKKVNYFK